MSPVKCEAFLNRWIEGGPPCLRREGEHLAIRLPADLPNRHLVETIIAMDWELHALDVSAELVVNPCTGLSPWSFYEVALKTGFRPRKLQSTPSWEDILLMTDACRVCRSHVRELLRDRNPMTQDLYQLEESCLLRWKREMRTPPANRQPWPVFHHTAAIIKPSLPQSKSMRVAAELARFKRVAGMTRTLTARDVFFIYSTAYGEAFTGALLSYHTSGLSQIILLKGPNIIAEQAAAKRMIREAAGVVDERRNLIHFPDSLGETYATIAYLFGEDLARELIVECYAGSVVSSSHE